MSFDNKKCTCGGKGRETRYSGRDQQYRTCPVCFPRMDLEERQRVKREIIEWTIKV